jgi:hypothetical protein
MVVVATMAVVATTAVVATMAVSAVAQQLLVYVASLLYRCIPSCSEVQHFSWPRCHLMTTGKSAWWRADCLLCLLSVCLAVVTSFDD